jgi:hypothetical protein
MSVDTDTREPVKRHTCKQRCCKMEKIFGVKQESSMAIILVQLTLLPTSNTLITFFRSSDDFLLLLFLATTANRVPKLISSQSLKIVETATSISEKLLVSRSVHPNTSNRTVRFGPSESEIAQST